VEAKEPIDAGLLLAFSASPYVNGETIYDDGSYPKPGGSDR